MGAIGPVLAFTVPPIRERLGYRPPEPIPTTYPRAFTFLFFPSPLPPSSFLPSSPGLDSRIERFAFFIVNLN